MNKIKRIIKTYWPSGVLVVGVLFTTGTLLFLGGAGSSNNASSPRRTVNDITSITTVEVSTVMPNNRRICIHEGRVTNWPIQEAMQAWNGNARNVFVMVNSDTVKTTKCDGMVLLHEEKTAEYWGVTQYTGTPTIRVGLSINVPTKDRLHVLCHEFGHVLGLPHLPNIVPNLKSCMNIGTPNVQLYHPSPTPEDLKTVSQDLWDWDKARQSGHR